MQNNIEYSKEWLLREIIKTNFKEKQTKQKEIITISKLELLKLVQKFIKLNEKGEY